MEYSDGTLLRINTVMPSSCESASHSVEIIEIPRNMTKDKLIMFLENTKRSGGGTISKIQYDECNRMAVVAFEDHKGKQSALVS